MTNLTHAHNWHSNRPRIIRLAYRKLGTVVILTSWVFQNYFYQPDVKNSIQKESPLHS